MPALSRKDVLALKDILSDWAKMTLNAGDAETLRLQEAIAFSLRTKKFVKASRTRRVAKKKTRKGEWVAVRGDVLKRADGRCENCDRVYERLAADHMFGGGGRRLSLESVFTVWALCFECDQDKTRNHPGSAYWLERFVEHCNRQDREAVAHDGYRHAAEIAQTRLDAMALQGRTGEQT